jgi:hypothetical protein
MPSRSAIGQPQSRAGFPSTLHLLPGLSVIQGLALEFGAPQYRDIAR